MTTRRIKKSVGVCLAAMAAATMIAEGSLAMAQPSQGSDSSSQAPLPSGQYAPPPQGFQSGSASYDDRAQRADRDYADQYSRWAAQYCVDQRNNNTAAGANIGGVLGAVVGAGVAGHGDQGAGALVGGALGAGAGAAIGASSSLSRCPPGYVVRAGAPVFLYTGPYYAPGIVYAPGWYRPWRGWADAGSSIPTATGTGITLFTGGLVGARVPGGTATIGGN